MFARRLGTACVAGIVAAGVTFSALASPVRQSTVVSPDPVDWTPRVISPNGGFAAVYKVRQVGETVFAGGNFRQVQTADRMATYDRKNLFSFSATTGAIAPLSVSMNGSISAITSWQGSLYVGGTFSVFNGVGRRGLVKVDPATGVVDRQFDARLTGAVHDIQVVHHRLLIGGEFGRRLKAVNLHTGAKSRYLRLRVRGDLDGPGGSTPRVYRFAVNPQHTRLVAVGNFRTVNGRARARAFMVDLGTRRGVLDAWYYEPLGHRCSGQKDSLRDVDFAPNGRWFAMDGGGYVSRTGDLGSTICDAAARFETGIDHPTSPTWINYTGGDTLQSIAVTDAAVYVQGHNRWLDNPLGRNTCETSCVSRRGIGAISPTTGMALAWNPTKDLRVGGKDLLLTRAGLWVASDTITIGGETHERLALMPAS